MPTYIIIATIVATIMIAIVDHSANKAQLLTTVRGISRQPKYTSHKEISND